MGEIRGHTKPCNQAVRLELKNVVCSFMLPMPWEMSGQSLWSQPSSYARCGIRLSPLLFVWVIALVCSALYNAVVLRACFLEHQRWESYL